MKARPSSIGLLLDGLEKIVRGMAEPLSTKLDRDYHHDPFILLIGCLLSLRTRDTVTYPVCKKLFARASTPEELLRLPLPELEELIHSVNYYRTKALVLRGVSQQLLDRFGGRVPSSEAALLSLPGVGRKTANLVRASAFGIPALAVDTHVHRLANEIGLVHTSTPEETERALKRVIPRDRWIQAHTLLVTYGQNKGSVGVLKRILWGDT